MEALLDEKQVSKLIGFSLACLRRWRLVGEGPEYKKLGSRVRYRPEAIALWLEQQPSGGNGRRLEPTRNHHPRSVSTGRRKAVSVAAAPAVVETASAA